MEFRLGDLLDEGSKNPVNPNDYKRISIKLNRGGLFYVTANKATKNTRPFYVRHAGEIIVGKQNFFNGSIAMVTSEFDNAVCSNAIMSFKPRNTINPLYLIEALSTPKFLKKVASLSNGTGQKELSEKDFLELIVRLPAKSIQDSFMNRINDLDSLIHRENKIKLSNFILKNCLMATILK